MTVQAATVEQVAAELRRGDVVAFTGAGISTEAGIPTFRDPGGLWERFDPEDFGTWGGLARLAMSRPDALAEFLSELRRVFAAARPGPAHFALARLDEAGLLQGVITQNVDGLHQEAGNRRVLEIHGAFARVVCLACGHREVVGKQAFLENLDRAVVGLRAAFVPSFASILPRCSRCGGPARPDFVAFGEPLRDFAEAEAMARECRVLLVVGTSGEVFPAATLPETASGAGAVIIEVAPGPTHVRSDLRIDGEAATVLPALVAAALA